MPSRGKVVIVGGGIIGVVSAWYLNREGWSVTVLDRKKIGAACSHGNCGLVCPSHVLPLTEPGAFKAAIKALLTPNSPFRIKPRMDPALWSWLWNFSRRCNHDAMVRSAHAIQALLASAMREYEQLVHTERIECEWQTKGLLFAYLDAAELDRYENTNQLLSEHFGEPATKLNAEQTVALEPALNPSIAGSWYYEHDAHLRPDILINSLRQRLEEQGVVFVEDCALTRIEGMGSEARAAETSQGSFTADAFLFACGAWSPQLKDQVGCKIPIEPGKGYSITMPRPQSCPTIPLIFPQHRVAVTPMQTGYRLGSIMEFAGYDESIRPERLQLLRSGAQPYLREPYCEPELETWYGWRPMTYDSLPVIDRTPRWQNAWVATGHNMLGLSMAPSSGRLISELMSEKTPHIDPAPYALSRFA
jgi:D-amino-acid dehydrogenase